MHGVEGTEKAVRDGFERHKIPLRSEQLEQFSLYLQLLEHWNERINLTAIRDRRMAVLRHFVEPAMAIGDLAGAGPVLADVGSGAGIPGLPMKILDPERDCVLVESNTKKATFLKEVVDALGLERVSVVDQRLESAIESGEIPAPVHVLTARAWTGWGPMLGLVATIMSPGGRALLFVGEETLRALRRNLSTGTVAATPSDRDWGRAARAGWTVKRAKPLPHLDRGYLVSMELAALIESSSVAGRPRPRGTGCPGSTWNIDKRFRRCGRLRGSRRHGCGCRHRADRADGGA